MCSVWLARSRLITLGTLVLVVSVSLVAGFARAHSAAAHGPGRLIASPIVSWHLVSSPNVGDTTTNNVLSGLAAVSSTDLWAVGCSSCDGTDGSRTGATLIEQWNGTKWSIVTSPNPGNAADVLNATAANSATDVWAVGFKIVVGVGLDQTLVEHYDGSSWQGVMDASPGGVSLLQGVAARTASDVWAVGFTEQPGTGGSSTYIEHYDGTQWTQSASQSPGYYNTLTSVAALSASNVWAVGGELDGGSTSTPLVEHFDGSKWSAISLPTSLSGLDGTFGSVAATAANNVWVVGSYSDPSTGYTHTLVAHWNGSTWSRVPSPDLSTYSALYSIAAVSPTSIWATGSEYAGGSTPGPLTEYWNGCQWTVESAPSANSFDNTLRAVAAGNMGSTAWAVGDYQAGATGAFEKTLAETVTSRTPLIHSDIIQCV